MTERDKLFKASYATLKDGKLRLLTIKQAEQVADEACKSCTDSQILEKVREIACMYGASIFGIISRILGTPNEVGRMHLKAETVINKQKIDCTVKLIVAMRALLRFQELITRTSGVTNVDQHTHYEQNEIDKMLDILRGMIVDDENTDRIQTN